VRRIKRLRLRRLAAYQIARILGMARSTVSAVLVRLGLNRLKVLEPKQPANSYEHARPGDMLHLDTKKLGRIRGVGHRIHGNRATRQRGVGWEFAHVCIDDHSRVAYVEVLGDEKGATAAGFLERAVRWFAQPRCEQLGVRHKRTRPYRPRTNGKAERLIQTLLREWAYAKPYLSSRGRRLALQPWLRYYNHLRPHGSLDCRPPMTRISGSG
jgi:transposase InsO family protein